MTGSEIRSMNWIKMLFKFPIVLYRKWISPLKPPTCRFYPSCSEYALQSIETHGPVKGAWLTVKRLGKCHPFHPGGFDPVPPPKPPTVKRNK